jgi:release factor glutamine methyltransferase
LYLNFERVLTLAEQDILRQLVMRRGEREPLQHIIGSTSFCGLEIAVNRHVLVPRPETELLAERGWTFLKERVRLGLTPTALDFGTGTGCLAIALAAQCLTAQITALDIAPEALAIARKNALHHQVAERVSFLLGDGLAAVPRGQQFDLIVANPPYIPTAEIDLLQPEVRSYDPRGALDGGPDGLNFYRDLASGAGELLKPEAKLMLEFGDGQETQLADLFQKQNWIVEDIVQDYTQCPRLLLARKNI